MEEINNQNGSGNSNENQGSNENVNQNQEQTQSNNGTNQNQEQVQPNNGTNQNQVQPQQNSGVNLNQGQVQQNNNANQNQGQVQQNNNANQNQGQVKPNYNPNQNNNTKKKSKAPIIIVVVIIVLLLFGCVVLGVGIVGFKFITENKKGASNVIENLIDSNSNRNKSSSVNTNKNTNTNKNKNTNSNTNTNTNTNTSTDITGQTTVTDAKTSSKENPLSTGTWGIASKYSTEDKKDEEVYVKVTKYVRGEEAKKAVQDYVNSSSFYKYEEPKEGLEWVVVDYDIDFANYKRSSLGSNARVSVSIKGAGNRSSVVYNGTTWILSSTYIGKSDYVKTQTAQGKVAFQMPIGCTDYILQFGEYNETNAFFKGE